MDDALERRLLVPMNVEALVIGASPATDWVDLKPDFRGVYLNQYLGQQLEPEPCSTKGPGLNREPGVHLHWALPDGLTHGVAREGSQPEFPLIPNRWLVVRLWDQGQKQPEPDLQCKAWIVESDTITDDPDGAVWPTLGVGRPDAANEHDYAARVGRQFELGRWPGETSAPSVEITAVGYGDPSFAAYYPAARRMLGFYDFDLGGIENVPLTYLVAGWYARPADDPLHRALTAKTLARLGDFLGETQWIYPGYAEADTKARRAGEVESDLREAREMAQRISAARSGSKEEAAELQRQIGQLEQERANLAAALAAIERDLPGRILCHGIISGIQWRTKDTLYDTGVPRGKPFSVAAGNTFVEALAALFGKTGLDSGATKLLEAFQYDLLAELEKPDGDDKFAHKTHERTYRPLARGIRWDLIEENPGGGTTGERAPPIPGDIRVLLESVNIQQRQINRLKRERDSRKSELYATWYKTVLDASQADLAPQMTILQRQIGDLGVRIAALEDAKEGRPSGAQWDALAAQLETLMPGYKLQELDEPRFWRPNDPVVLMAGQAFQRSGRHGEDGRYRADGRLLCRLSGQEVTAVTISIPNARIQNVEFGPADLDRWCAPLPQTDGGPLPPDVRLSLCSLFHETLLLTLDAKRARLVAAAAYDKNAPGLAKDHVQEISELATSLMQRLQQALDDAGDPARVDNMGSDGAAAPGTPFSFQGAFPSAVGSSAWQKNPWLPLFLQWQVTWTPSYSETPRALESWALNGAGTEFTGNPSPQGETQIYGGTTLLTPGAALHFSERMRQYNLTHDNPELRSLQTAVGAMSLLCQTLGGLTDNLLMRKGRLELRPLDPGTDGRGPQPAPIYDWVHDIDWLSPLTDAAFFPIRAGHMRLEKLWIIDAFGQLLQLEEEDAAKLQQPIVHERLGGAGAEIRLEPRLAQPARLDIDWLPAHCWNANGKDALPGDGDAFDPVCGWVVPNLLDRGLMIYDARGRALGALQAVQRKSWDQGAGAKREEIESFHWVDIPGSGNFFFGTPPRQISDPLGEGANPHLREYVRALLSLSGESGAAFGQLLDKMDETLSAEGGSGSTRNPSLALLIGRPLALVRAVIRLELDGDPALAQGWNEVQKAGKDRSGGVEKARFPVRLGDRSYWNGTWLGEDGLAGFFLRQDYSRFYPAYGLQGRDDSYSTHGWTPEISIEAPLDLTLLMDPSRGVCATTGVLPRIFFNLPYGDIAETLENKQVVFFTGPLITTAAAVRMPQPSDLYGQWSWTHHPAVQVWREDSITDTRKEEARFFDDALQVAEGWLKLVTAPVAVRTFRVQGLEPVRKEQAPARAGDVPAPARYELRAAGSVVLAWDAIGADEIELREGGTTLLKSARHPLPVQCRVRVDGSALFTLLATGRAEHPGAAPQETATKTIEVSVVAGAA